ncbi:two-component system, OmpR family, sensor kinase [Tistlia consotensis]|uniref:histidine kinase n=1 Tax=Tistlia consotensis USBA 355 TaxID=560819 RepID=A0A1Y6CIR1_9PROT|nr:HAMP domain-containing sensor histidine kinase [Tistlia consotensis]SMF64584.1 two-component system, OmpR family, sensor kinase [Tistlia consotensis USBA 355]SNR97280.1 two-component system, OmpR family, sensor kinase [Tistlia consotensis]
MSGGFSLSRRLVGRLTLGLSALWLIAVAGSALALRDELDEIFDSALQETAQRLLPLTIDELRDSGSDRDESRDESHNESGDEHEERAIDRPDTVLAEHEEYLIYQLRDAAGHVLLRSHDAPHEPFPVAPQRGFGEAGGLRVYGERGPRGLTLQVAEPLVHRTEAMSELFVWLAAPLLLLVPLAAGAIFWTVRGSLQPIGRLRDAIHARGGGNLAPLPDEGLPRELQAIIRDVNRLLGRLSQTLEGERAFAANSAHELRTPVAAALAQSQRLAAELRARGPEGGAPGTAKLQQRVAGLIDSLHGLSGLVEKLLQLARAEAGLGLDNAEADLLPVVRLLVDEIGRRPAGAGRLVLAPGGPERLDARLDLDAFGIALRNLIDNALRHGSADEAVTVTVGSDRSVAVVNAGPVVPPDRLAKLGTRFERAGATTSGSGLGLAIAGTILEQAGGSLELRSPASGRSDGFEARIRLP